MNPTQPNPTLKIVVESGNGLGENWPDLCTPLTPIEVPKGPPNETRKMEEEIEIEENKIEIENMHED